MSSKDYPQDYPPASLELNGYPMYNVSNQNQPYTPQQPAYVQPQTYLQVQHPFVPPPPV